MGEIPLSLIFNERPDLLLIFFGVPSKTYKIHEYENPLISGLRLITTVEIKRASIAPGDRRLEIFSPKDLLLVKAVKVMRHALRSGDPIAFADYAVGFEIRDHFERSLRSFSGKGYVASLYIDLSPEDQIMGFRDREKADEILKINLEKLLREVPGLEPHTRTKINELAVRSGIYYRPVIIIRIPRLTRDLKTAVRSLKQALVEMKMKV